MKSLTTQIRKFLREEDGVTAIEYGLIAGLISVAIIAALILVGNSLVAILERIASALESVPAGG